MPCLVSDVNCQLSFIRCFKTISLWILFYTKHDRCRHDKSVQKEFMFKIEQVKNFIINATKVYVKDVRRMEEEWEERVISFS